MDNASVAASFYDNPNKDCKGSNFFVDAGVLYSFGHHFPVAMNLEDDYVLLNGDRYSPTTSTHQGYARQAVPVDFQIIIPFSALERAFGLQSSMYYRHEYLRKIRVIETIRSTEIPYTYKDKDGNEKIGYHHTLGGSVFEYQGRYFISGIDDTSRRRAYFLTELNRKASDFANAIEALKPEPVRQAEANGIEVKRQGEWFFTKLDGLNFDGMEIIKNALLPDQNNNGGHHQVSELLKVEESLIPPETPTIVRGIVKHTLREHTQLKLYDNVKEKSWWAAFMNQQLGSWSAGGNVD